MKRKIICLLWLSIPLLCMAQPGRLNFSYEYDDAGNRVCRKVVYLPDWKSSPTEDSTTTKLFVPEYFVEKIAQVEMKIYPNPTTEKITLEISNMENLQTGTFKLFSITGQFLQEQPVHSATTTVSLAGLPKGTYLLKVQINHRTEEWKIIKQ
ncbi:MAG: T9SS type A sorting domain-containing protein [Bacteroidetes bacterium]|nr:T9SS type A sorting domain-containing protein [Bacteroidota bacterium]MCL2302893.1 T9SS type A sorting domain-containing protein [Lentimicrobiaceae bacterium]